MIIRDKHKDNFTIISNYYLKDPRLNVAQKGLLTIMLSLPDDWIFHLRPLQERTGQGKGALERNLRVLENAGYLIRGRMKRNSNGKFSYSDWVVHETSQIPYTQKPCTHNPSTVNADADYGYTENEPLLMKNKQSTDRSKTDLSSSDSLSTQSKEELAREAEVLAWLDSFKHRKQPEDT